MITDQATRHAATRSNLCELFLVSLPYSLQQQTLLYNSKHVVLMFRSWPEPLLQVDPYARILHQLSPSSRQSRGDRKRGV